MAHIECKLNQNVNSLEAERRIGSYGTFYQTGGSRLPDILESIEIWKRRDRNWLLNTDAGPVNSILTNIFWSLATLTEIAWILQVSRNMTGKSEELFRAMKFVEKGYEKALGNHHFSFEIANHTWRCRKDETSCVENKLKRIIRIFFQKIIQITRRSKQVVGLKDRNKMARMIQFGVVREIFFLRESTWSRIDTMWFCR